MQRTVTTEGGTANAAALDPRLPVLASMGRVSPFHNRLVLPLAMAFGGTLFYIMMNMALRYALGYQVAFADNLLWVAIPSAILNTILMPVVYSSMLWLSLKVGRRVTVEW